MDLHAPDALVTGYEDLIEGLRLPGPSDRHVLAAAIVGRAGVIVTANLKHFPSGILARFGIEPCHPDDFSVHLLEMAPGVVATAAHDHRESLENPPQTIDQYLDTLRSQGLPRTVAILKQYLA